MTSPAAELPIAIDRVERARGEGENVRLRLIGRWLDPDHAASEHDPLLVVQLQGRRHRFAATREPEAGPGVPGAWQADFLDSLLGGPEPPGAGRGLGGNAVVAVGPPGSPPARRRPVPAGSGAVPGPATATAAPAEPAAASAVPAAPVDLGRAGPLADLLLKETVAALHAELERRSTEAAQLRGALAEAQSELEARAARQAGLETAHGELRHELEQLMEAVPRQRREFEERLTAAEDELDRAREELAMAAAARDEALAEARGAPTGGSRRSRSGSARNGRRSAPGA